MKYLTEFVCKLKGHDWFVTESMLDSKGVLIEIEKCYRCSRTRQVVGNEDPNEPPQVIDDNPASP